MMQPVTVAELNERIKSLLESHFIQVRVEGEISRVTYHTSGHIYFTIKDERSAIDCVMFRSNARSLRFRLEQGQHVIVGGSVTVYVPRGNYQLMVQSVEPYGEGALALAFEQLKKRLMAEGLFAPERKKPIPRTIRHIAVVTSKTGAAIQDMIRVASKRWPLVKITLVDTLVQGAGAAAEIARHIAYADRLGADVLVVGRGGGSLEDLWAFNEEVVARAIAACQTPVVSAVGHEVDTLISDFVADMRAPTPSAAMEQILPDRVETLYAIDEMMESMRRRMAQILGDKTRLLQHWRTQMEQHAISRRIALQLDAVHRLERELSLQMRRLLERKAEALPRIESQLRMAEHHILESRSQTLEALQRQLLSLDPKNRLRPGFVQLVKEGRTATLESLRPGEKIRLEDGRYVADATVDAVKPL
ncbi:exodeoxyribonuclease VII large subunit [Hydrogenimonas sp. SS33]|uniref:exodeoxyribonuclease VII large subunit n=1 Tax=Hydrogenimonas leucolamina TaxID=2954236 RepID=UPI00336BC3A6